MSARKFFLLPERRVGLQAVYQICAGFKGRCSVPGRCCDQHNPFTWLKASDAMDKCDTGQVPTADCLIRKRLQRSFGHPGMVRDCAPGNLQIPGSLRAPE